MKIIIDYSSTWRNSVLTGSNDKPVNKDNKRSFKASSKSKEDIDTKEITDSTILGILCRLIGDQRKLYQAKTSDDFYFKDMDISYKHLDDRNKKIWTETALLVNKSENRPSQGSFIGVLNKDEPLFFSEYSATLWAILDYDFNELLDFILNPSVRKVDSIVSPKHILNRVLYEIPNMDNIQFIEDKIEVAKDRLAKECAKEKSSDKRISTLTNELNLLKEEAQQQELIQFERKIKLSISTLQERFSDVVYVEKNKSIYPIRLYAGALYLLVDELKKKGVDTSPLISKNGTIKGFSKRAFNGVRDFLNPLMGNQKKTTHTPYNLTKADGKLEINLDVDRKKYDELKNMIDCAGVSSFYLGKKGLAYVSQISMR